MTAASHGHRDLRATAWLLAFVLAGDASGADVPAARLFAGAQGFAWRDSWWASTLLHGGGRGLAWALVAALVWAALRKTPDVQAGPDRRRRIGWLGVMMLCAVAVPAMKRFSATSCAWDLAEFGGAARYVSHWQWGLADGGPGHCFPSGHAVAAFAFLGMYFMWRDHDCQRSRIWLLAVMVAGTLFGVAQLVRGAHYPSHTLWSAWVCWAVCAGAAWVERAWAARPSKPMSVGFN